MIYLIGHLKPDLDSAVSVLAAQFLFQKVKCFGYTKTKAVLANPANEETETIFKKFHQNLPPVLNKKQIKSNDKFILLDHNEKEQMLPGIQTEQIVEIIDHHKINLSLPFPIYLNFKPWGATNTIIAFLMCIYKVKPKKNLASLMISAILSDTQGFKSPTTTKQDKQMVSFLNKSAKIKNLDKLTLEIFKAKSNLKNLTFYQIATLDYKIYNFKNKKVFISQVETVEQEKLLKNAFKIIKALEKVKNRFKVDYVFCILTDVLKVNSKAIINPEGKNLLIKSFKKAKLIGKGVYDIGPILSRKKEIVPAIEKAI